MNRNSDWNQGGYQKRNRNSQNQQNLPTVDKQTQSVPNQLQIQPFSGTRTNANMIAITEKRKKECEDVVLCNNLSLREIPEFEKFFNSLSTHASKFPSEKPAEPEISECLKLTLKVEGQNAKTLGDSGAEANIVNPEFLYNLAKKLKLDLMDWGFNPNSGFADQAPPLDNKLGEDASLVAAGGGQRSTTLRRSSADRSGRRHMERGDPFDILFDHLF
ncbi:hypothetical protein niasHS_008034 [Heterodera schachtii]|uniref:Uncharacterized protein n=1 Tax=Heterodera schachtii TaxID=97005 RepID=A0ABD2JAU9_HETSC